MTLNGAGFGVASSSHMDSKQREDGAQVLKYSKCLDIGGSIKVLKAG